MKADAFQVITDRIIGLLESGTVPWQKPWTGGAGMPRNLISRKEYRGINTFLLHAMMYECPFWLTFNPAKGLGGHVKQGEKACPVFLEVAGRGRQRERDRNEACAVPSVLQRVQPCPM